MSTTDTPATPLAEPADTFRRDNDGNLIRVKAAESSAPSRKPAPARKEG